MLLSAKNIEVDELLAKTTPTDQEKLLIKICQAAFVTAIGEKALKIQCKLSDAISEGEDSRLNPSTSEEKVRTYVGK